MELNTVNEYIKAKLTHSIHTSARRSFRGCKRRYDYVFNNFWYPNVTPKPLEFGVAFHKAMEVAYAPETWHDREAAMADAILAFKDTVLKQKNAYRAAYDMELSDEAEQDYNDRVTLGIAMLKYYGKKFLPQETLTPIKVEIAFEVPIKHSDGRDLWCKCDTCWDRYCKHRDLTILQTAEPDQINAMRWAIDLFARERSSWKGLPVTYGGRIDVLFQDEYGRLWIGDWKTASRITEDGKDFFLQLDDQITSYCWALWTLGIDVAGFLYMEIKKAVPEEPEPLTRRFKGRLYSASKSNNYEYETYYKTVEENDPVAFQEGLYDEYLDWLRIEGQTYHYRHQQDRSEDELRIAGDNIFLEAADMTDPNMRIYPSPGRFSCQFCAFQEPCMAENRGDSPLYLLGEAYTKREYHYWEKTQPSTEGKGGQ